MLCSLAAPLRTEHTHVSLEDKWGRKEGGCGVECGGVGSCGKRNAPISLQRPEHDSLQGVDGLLARRPAAGCSLGQGLGGAKHPHDQQREFPFR